MEGKTNQGFDKPAATLPGIDDGIDLPVHLRRKASIELGADVLRQRLIVRKMPVHRHLRAADLLRHAPHRELLIALLDKHLTCGFDDALSKSTTLSRDG